jgi:translation initiation factor eIF-2B subunit alpha
MVLESTAARKTLKETQSSLGVQAGSELWELFFNAASLDFPTNVPGFKEHLIKQGTYFCNVHAEDCRKKIADVAVGFLRDDSTVSPEVG